MIIAVRRQDFFYELPEKLIAKQPASCRTGSRLLCLEGDSGGLKDCEFTDIEHFLNQGDVLVLNNTKVIPARLFGQKLSGGKIEILVERVLDSHRVLAHIKSSKSPKPGTELLLFEGENKCVYQAGNMRVEGRQDALFELYFLGQQTVLDVLDSIGHMPLPPYIDRADNASDRKRYQTVYSEKPGAVAAPTAGLHFDNITLDKLRDKGVEIAFVTLHVGAGTFQPVRADNIAEHKMHAEYYELSQEVADKVNRAKLSGKRVVAVGTTSVRTLESAGAFGDFDQTGKLSAMQGDTDIFIYPGKKIRIVDALITNFHLPESTLIMLVSAFAGYKNTMNAYHHAVKNEYRFFSYGDAMFITLKKNA